MTDPNADDKELVVFGIDFGKLSRVSQFLVSSTFIFLFYLIYGYLQESIFKTEDIGPHSWYISFTQFLLYTVFGLIEVMGRTRCGTRGSWKMRIPLRTYCVIAFLSVTTMGLSNESVVYLNYPTQVVFKCCKLIPVMVGGIFIQKKRYNVYDFAGCFAMSIGLIVFTLADSIVQPHFNFYGVVLISFALMADAVIGNVQERAMREHRASSAEVVLYSYAIGAVYILVGLLVTQTLTPSIHFFAQRGQLYIDVFLFSLTGYFGVSFVMLLVKTHGALVGVTVTTARKAVSIVLSFIVFTKPFSMQYLLGGLLVVIGIYLNTVSKNPQKIKQFLKRFSWHRAPHRAYDPHMV